MTKDEAILQLRVALALLLLADAGQDGNWVRDDARNILKATRPSEIKE